MKKVLLIGIVLVFLVPLGALACNPLSPDYFKAVHETPLQTAKTWISLSIEHNMVDLGDLSDKESADFYGKNRLWIDGNVEWSLSVSVGGPPAGEHWPSYFLQVLLRSDHESASTTILSCQKATIWVDYHLRNLQYLPTTDYLAVVTYTITTR